MINPNRKNEALAGGLFIIATVTFMIGNGMIGSMIDDVNYLGLVHPHKTTIMIGLLLEFINSIAVVAISVALFPSLRANHEGVALGYIGFRIIESVILIVGMIFLLLLVPLSHDYIRFGANDTLSFQSTGNLLVQGYSVSFQVAMLVLGFYSLILCYVLYQYRLTPRYLAMLGLIGYGCLIVSACTEIVGYRMGMWLYLPGAVFEIVFPIRLIVKGLDQPPLLPARAMSNPSSLKQISHSERI